jgi:tetratricopeptide (TPR) repeat protein
MNTKGPHQFIPKKLADGVRRFRNEANVPDGQPVEPSTALPNAHIRLAFGTHAEASCARQAADSVVVDASVKDDAVAMRYHIAHNTAHSILVREGLDRDKIAEHMRLPLAAAANEMMADHITTEMLIPGPALQWYLRANPNADNFDAAQHFGVPLDVMTRRIIEVLASPFTRDKDFDRRVLQEILRRCFTRVRVAGEGLIGNFIPRDPPILAGYLIYTEALKTLRTIVHTVASPGEAAGHTILIILKSQSSFDVQIFVEHLPLTIIEDVIFSLAVLPPSHAPVALAIFYSKLAQYDAARRMLTNVHFSDKTARAEAISLLARIEMRVNKVDGAVRAEEMYRQASSIDRNCIEALTGRSAALTAQERYPEAIKVLNSLGNVPAANYHVGRAYEESGRLEVAAEYFERVTQLWDGHPYWRKAKYRLASLHARLGNHLFALAHYAELFERHPYDAESLRAYVALLLKLENFDEAVQRILTLAHVAPLQPWAFRMLGNVYEVDGRDDFAVPLWLEARLLEQTFMNRIAA